MRNPNPEVWPRCSECKVDYVLRRAVVFVTKPNWLRRLMITNEWVWQRDCKHRKAAPEVVHRVDPKNKKKRSKR